MYMGLFCFVLLKHGLVFVVQLDVFTGYLVLESFSSPEEIEAMRKRMDELLDEFDPSTTSTIFSTKTHVTM